MPEVLAVDVSYRAWPWRYLLKTHILGEEQLSVYPRRNARDLADAYREMGRAVGELQAIPFPSFGELDANGRVLDGTDCLTALAARAQRMIPGARGRETSSRG